MTKLLAGSAFVLIALVAGPVAIVVAAFGDPLTGPSQAAVEEIPPAYLGLYQQATLQRCQGMPWPVLAAIGRIESNHGSYGGSELQPDGSVQPPIIGIALDGNNGTVAIADSDGGRYDGDTTYDRAVGPMQFIPTTWDAYGLDASSDGVADPHNAVDAIHTAATYLCSSGADDPQRLPRAIWAYNHSWNYVQAVLDQAAIYASAPSGAIVPASDALIAMVLANPRLDIYEAGRVDIATGRIDARILTILHLASQRHTLSISSLRTGHSRCIGGGDYDGCRVSHHWHGRGADISTVDGHPVSRFNTAARELTLWLTGLPESLSLDEIGVPWPDLAPLPTVFSDLAHADHIHLAVTSDRR